MRDNTKPLLLFGTGEAYSRVAKEVEKNFRYWMIAANIEREKFLKEIQSEDMEIVFSETEEVVQVAFSSCHRTIGIPLVWEKDGDIDFESFKMDTALLLLFIAASSESSVVEDKVRCFIKNHLKK